MKKKKRIFLKKHLYIFKDMGYYVVFVFFFFILEKIRKKNGLLEIEVPT